MAGTNMIWEMIFGLTGIMAIIGIITAVITREIVKKRDYARNIYLGKMSNTDLSLQEAIKYLKLTNGINSGVVGEKGNE